jgi:hypothetical protein
MSQRRIVAAAGFYMPIGLAFALCSTPEIGVSVYLLLQDNTAEPKWVGNGREAWRGILLLGAKVCPVTQNSSRQLRDGRLLQTGVGGMGAI